MSEIALALVRTRAQEAEDLGVDTTGRVKNWVMGDNGFRLPDGVEVGGVEEEEEEFEFEVDGVEVMDVIGAETVGVEEAAEEFVPEQLAAIGGMEGKGVAIGGARG